MFELVTGEQVLRSSIGSLGIYLPSGLAQWTIDGAFVLQQEIFFFLPYLKAFNSSQIAVYCPVLLVCIKLNAQMSVGVAVIF
tara:strand:+ start:994 stop:1239 length:246 start_codon:yes stop_codon:yes gene_type:complete